MRRTGIPKTSAAGWSSIRAGFKYIAHDPKLAAIVSLKGGVSIVGTSWVLLPVMGERVFQAPDRRTGARASGIVWDEPVDGGPRNRRASGTACSRRIGRGSAKANSVSARWSASFAGALDIYC